ncbi:MAG TPA: hypothetical protein VIV11_36260, partial [Kofleriaceae bacterium]
MAGEIAHPLIVPLPRLAAPAARVLRWLALSHLRALWGEGSVELVLPPGDNERLGGSGDVERLGRPGDVERLGRPGDVERLGRPGDVERLGCPERLGS